MQTQPFILPEEADLTKVRAELRKDVARRLQPVCSEWPREDFEEMVEKVTETTIKYAQAQRSSAA